LISENAYTSGYTGVGGRGIAPAYENQFYYDTFPETFKWGVASEGKFGKKYYT